LALSEVLAIAARVRCVDEYKLLTAGRDGDLYTSRERRSGRGRHSELHTGIALCRACAPHAPAHRTFSRLRRECRTPYREPLQFIVIAVTSVMSGTFPDTNGVFYVTMNCWRVRGPSRHRHDERHRRNALPKRPTRRREPCQPNPTNPTRRARSPVPMRSLRSLAASGLSNLPRNPTLLPDERNGPSSGLSRAPSGQHLEPDNNKPLTYAGYSGYRRVCRVLGEGMREDTRGE
jgi:hypothetical protein